MEGIDCATKLTASSAQALKRAGIGAVGRYLGRTLWNGLTPDEVNAIHNAGLSLFLIWELAPTKKAYFTYAKGVSDAAAAIVEAKYLGAPDGIAIYFTVDYDAQPGDMASIRDYFQGVKDGLGSKYLMGVYGSYAVMQSIDADRYFQTYAWSKGQKAPNHIYQYQNDVILAGIAVDRDYVNEDAGLWGGEINVGLDVAVLLNTKEDYWAGTDVAAKNGNCAMFIRPADLSVPKDAMTVKKLIVIGGAKTGHPNEVLLSGKTKYDTAACAGEYIGQVTKER